MVLYPQPPWVPSCHLSECAASGDALLELCCVAQCSCWQMLCKEGLNPKISLATDGLRGIAGQTLRGDLVLVLFSAILRVMRESRGINVTFCLRDGQLLEKAGISVRGFLALNGFSLKRFSWLNSLSISRAGW